MTIRWSIIAAGLSAAILLVILRLRGGSNQPSDELTAARGNAANQPPAAMTVLRKKVTSVLAAHRADSAVANDGATDFSAELLNAAGAVFDDMHAVGGFVHTRAARSELADRLLAMPRSIDLLGRILTTPDFALDVFGEKQAEARFYAITALGRAAERGNDEPLSAAANALAAALTTERDFDRGRMADLRDLIETYAGTRTKGQLGTADLQKLGYSPTHPEAVRKVYVEALLQAVWKSEGFLAARRYVQGVFPDG